MKEPFRPNVYICSEYDSIKRHTTAWTGDLLPDRLGVDRADKMVFVIWPIEMEFPMRGMHETRHVVSQACVHFSPPKVTLGHDQRKRPERIMILCILWVIICSTCSTCSLALLALLPYPPNSQRRHDRAALTRKNHPKPSSSTHKYGPSHQLHTVGSQPLAL